MKNCNYAKDPKVGLIVEHVFIEYGQENIADLEFEVFVFVLVEADEADQGFGSGLPQLILR